MQGEKLQENKLSNELKHNIHRDKIFSSGPSKICGRQPKKFDHIPSNFCKGWLSSTNFTWSTLEYLDSIYSVIKSHCLPIPVTAIGINNWEHFGKFLDGTYIR